MIPCTLRMAPGKATLAKNIIRHPYMWPGGYERVGITDEGALLCVDCMKAEFRQIAYAARHRLRDGWNIVGSTYDATGHEGCPDELKAYCDHCGREFGELVA